ncbi:MAG: DNA polymerase III subunit alpha, partial [Deltaproteobacteria bacterium CG_4_10_14_0_2_um_filter_43_8]
EEKRKVYLDRLERELGIIKQMGFAGYFLIVADFISFARKSSLPVGPGRGSAAGSLVAYVMGITNIDPLLHDLLFERFLNPERISMPDVDIDFCMRRRDEVIDYVAQKYGNVAQIITFGKMKAKAGIRDVGRVLGLPYADVDRIAKLVPDTLGTTLQTALEQEPKLVDAMKKDPQIAKLIEIAKKLEGYPRHASTHAAGVVIGDKELTEYLPLSKGQNDEVITQFDMKAVESVGLIKFDFLGLKTLTVIDDTLQLIQKHRGETLNIDDIPLDDELVYQKLSEGDTLGIFQLEGQGMTELILKLKPSSFEDIVALVALFRPGPLGSGMVDDFIDRKHGRKAIEYSLPHLAPILKDTYGVIVYQEQVMRIASELAGFSLGDADLLRRAMGKKKPEEMEKQREKFLEGAKKNEIPDAKAEFIFDLMAKFAEYGFNKSHSAAYALVSYQTAYLKFHYPTEYMAAIMTCDQGSTDKVLPYIADCKTHAIQVLPPDVNESVKDFSVIEEGIIRFGLGAVKNVGAAAIESIVHEREKTEAYRSLHDFCRRVDTRKVNKRVLESLIKCGAFDFIKTTRASLFSGLDHALEMAFSHQRDRLSGQVSFFDTFNSSDTEFTEEKLPELPEWQEKERLSYEKETLGLYITGHPLHQYELLLKTYATSNTLSVQEVKKNKEVRVGGLVSRMKEIMTRKGDRMAFVTLEDLQGTVELVVFSDLYSEASDLIKSDEPLFVTGLAESDGETVKIIAKDICSVDEVAINFTKSVHFYLDTKQVQSSDLDELKKMLTQHKGSCPSFLHFLTDGKTETVLSLPPQLYVMPSRELAHDISHRFGEDVMKFTTV